MRKLTSILSFAFLCCFITLQAQTTNYSLRLQTQGNVSLGQINELNGLTEFTIQFWFNPTNWTKDASIISRGNDFSISLGNEGELSLNLNGASLPIQSNAFQPNKWSHLTLIQDASGLKARVNNVEVASFNTNVTIPSSVETVSLGVDYEGRIDELRIWNTALSADHNYMWQNTLNQYHPQWDNLVSYYKFDQDLCDNIVDYKYNHHGTMTESGASREAVTDNDDFRYFIVAAYSDFSRFADRAIDREKYLLANTLIILGINSHADGTASVGYPDNHGTVTNGAFMDEYKGRNKVLSLNGAGAKMTIDGSPIKNNSPYTFATWIYIEEWTEGAFIFKKEKSDNEGFSIRLGLESNKQIIVRIDGREYIRHAKMTVGEWVHFAVTTTNNTAAGERFLFSFNGVGSYPSRGNFPVEGGGYELTNMENVKAVIGENLNAKLDETNIWNTSKGTNNFVGEMTNGLPMPGLGIVVDAQTLHSTDSYWKYDMADDLGYDSYSYKHFIHIMKTAYEGYRGFTVKMSVSGHNNWENTFADANKRKSLGESIANIVNNSDLDGVDLDFEWTYNDTGWLNYAKLVEIIRNNLNPGKLLTVTPHKVSYRFPKAYMHLVDYFLFQIYGPDKSVFSRNAYTDAYNSFVSWGYPKNKIVMSYATTTSRGFDANGNTTGTPPIGVRNLFDDTYTPDQDRLYDERNKCYRYLTGYDQVLWRTEYMRREGCQGIFYWDMGNDVATSHPFSLPKASNFSMSANVDSIVTVVDNVPPTPPTGITSTTSSKNDLVISPNPVKDSIHLFESLSGESHKGAYVYDMSGKCVITESSSHTIDVSSLPKGQYSLVVYDNTNKRLSSIFMKL